MAIVKVINQFPIIVLQSKGLPLPLKGEARKRRRTMIVNGVQVNGAR